MSYTRELATDNIIQYLASRPAPCPPSPSWFIYEQKFTREQHMDGWTMCSPPTKTYEPEATERQPCMTSARLHSAASSSDAHMTDAPVTPINNHRGGTMAAVEPTDTPTLVASSNAPPHTPDSPSGQESSADVSPFSGRSPVLPPRTPDDYPAPSRTLERSRRSPRAPELDGMTDDHDSSQAVESASSTSSDDSLLHFLGSHAAYNGISHYSDIPQFVITQCLEASVAYLTYQRRQWASLFRPGIRSHWLNTPPPRTSPEIPHSTAIDLIMTYNNAGPRQPYLYLPSPEDCVSTPPPEPGLPTDSLVDNIKTINHLMWCRMKRRVSGAGNDDEEVVKRILRNIVLSRRVSNIHPDVSEFLKDVEAEYEPGEREDFVSMLKDQIAAAAQLCFWLGDKERSDRLMVLGDWIDDVEL